MPQFMGFCNWRPCRTGRPQGQTGTLTVNSLTQSTLGICAFYPVSAACIAEDYCLQAAGLDAKDLDLVVFYGKPLKEFDRLMEPYVAHAPVGLGSLPAARRPHDAQQRSGRAVHLRNLLGITA